MRNLCLLISIMLLSPAPATLAQPATTRAVQYARPLGIAMEEWPYPFPVKFHEIRIDGQTLRMAYMDVASRATSADSAPRTVVLLHGKNFYGSYWASTIEALTEAGYRVVVPDQIGFGKSAKPDLHYSFDFLAANTIALLDALNAREFAIVGHSMGGMLAVRLARDYPDRVKLLILENPIGLEDYRQKVPPKPVEHWYQQELKNTDSDRIRSFLKNYVVTWKPELYESFVEVRSRVAHSGEYPRFARSAALTYQMIYQQPVRHELKLITQPTLLVIGQEDRTTIGRDLVSEEVRATLGDYPALGKAARRDIPHCRLVEMDNVGHLPHLEWPEAFETEVIRFLNDKK